MRGFLPIGLVIDLYRYPVKSLLGEHLAALAIDQRGVAGDRLFAVRDAHGKFGSGKSTRRFRCMDGLFALRAAYRDDQPVIAFPDGAELAGDDPDLAARLSAHVGQPVTLAQEADIPHHDEGPVHLVTTASLRALGWVLDDGAPDARRFRPNIVLDVPGEQFLEETWAGREVQLGDHVRLRITNGAVRCVMIGMAQDDLAADTHLLRRIGKENGARFGVYAEVVMPGEVMTGDAVWLQA